MFKSIKTHILISVAALVFLTSATIFIFIQSKMRSSHESTFSENAANILSAVYLNVQNEYHSLEYHRNFALDMRKSELHSVIDLAFEIINQNYKKYKAGKISMAEAKRKSIATIKKMRYDNGIGYFWINDMGKPIPKMIMHATIPELDGTVLDDPKFNCALGKGENLFKAFVDVCDENGEGYVDYLWPKPTKNGLTPEQPKISYVRLFKEWDWVVGSGIYIDDIERYYLDRKNAIIEELDSTFKQISVGKNGYMFLFNSKKEMLIHPTLGLNDFKQMLNVSTSNYLGDDLIEASKHPNKPFDYLWTKPNSEKNRELFKKRSYISYFEPLDWYICSSYYVDDIDQQFLALRNDIIVISLFFLFIGLIISFILSTSLSRPIRDLADSAAKIELEAIDTSIIPAIGPTETKTLGLVLRKMLSTLQKSLEKQKRLISIIENTSDMVSWSSKDRKIEYLNKAGCDMLELNDNDIQQIQIRELHPAWAWELISKVGMPRAEEFGYWQGETAVVSNKGIEIPVSQVVIAHKNEYGKVNFYSTIVRNISVQKKHEEELLFKKNIIEASSSPIITFSNEGFLTYANPAFLQQWEISDYKTIDGKHILEYFKSADKQSDIFHDLKYKGKWQGYATSEYKSSSIMHLKINASAIYSSEGEPVSFMISTTDITDMVVAEAALKASEERYKETSILLAALFDAIPDILVVLDVDFNVLKNNAAGKTFSEGYIRELIGNKCHNILNTESKCKDCASIKALETKQISSIEKYLEQKDVWLDIRAYPIFDEEGNITKIIEHMRDISNYKKALDNLRKSENLYRSIIENIQDVYYRTDENGNLIMVSPSGVSTMKYDNLEEIIGLNIAQHFYYDPNERDIFLQELNKNGKVSNFQVTLKTKEGNPLTILTSSQYYYDPEGKPLGVEGVFSDISKRIEAEQEIKTLNEELEERVKERTRNLEILNEELQNFAYVVSHDLKAPLRGIGQLAQWISYDYYDILDESGKENLNLLNNRVTRLNSLIDGILKYSRAGRILSNIVAIDLSSLVMEILDLISVPFNVNVKIIDKLPVIKGDLIRIEQVFQNLIGNAIKYNDKKKGLIEISYEDNNNYWKFRIKDNGPGIDSKYHEKIFGIFQTLSTEKSSESTGIGLSIVKKIVEMHGGKIWVESNPGFGCSFFFTIKKEIKPA